MLKFSAKISLNPTGNVFQNKKIIEFLTKNYKINLNKIPLKL